MEAPEKAGMKLQALENEGTGNWRQRQKLENGGMENEGRNADWKMQASRDVGLENAGRIAGEKSALEIEGNSTHRK